MACVCERGSCQVHAGSFDPPHATPLIDPSFRLRAEATCVGDAEISRPRAVVRAETQDSLDSTRG